MQPSARSVGLFMSGIGVIGVVLGGYTIVTKSVKRISGSNATQMGWMMVGLGLFMVVAGYLFSRWADEHLD